MRVLKLQLLELVFLILSVNSINATTIVPYQNLALMGEASDYVVLARCVNNTQSKSGNVTRFYSCFEVIKNIGCNFIDTFIIEHEKYITPRYTRIIFGDVEYETGKNYLLFLTKQKNGLLKPILFSYGVYEEAIHRNENILIPLDLEHEIHTINTNKKSTPEPLAIFQKNRLLDMLTDCLQYNGKWHAEKSNYTDSNDLLNARLRTAPSHCHYFFETTDTLPHWPNFPTLPLPVWYHEDGVSSYPNIDGLIQNAMDAMHSKYGGIHLAMAGSHNFEPSCADGTAIGEDYVDWVLDSLGGMRHLVFQFDDPCNRLSSGTLAIGGILKLNTTHTEHGKLWRDASVGTIVLNNVSGATTLNVITHELSHAIGLQHIPSSFGPNNMRFDAGSAITNLDIQCVDYIYPASANDCDSLEVWQDFTIYTDMMIRATSEINVLNIDITNQATLTLIAPTILMDSMINIPLNNNLLTIAEDQCN